MAGLHSYTATLRHALAGTGVRVVESMPPAVATELGGSNHGADVDAFCAAALAGIDAGSAVVGYGATDTEAVRARLATEQTMFDTASARFPVPTYSAVAAGR